MAIINMYLSIQEILFYTFKLQDQIINKSIKCLSNIVAMSCYFYLAFKILKNYFVIFNH